MPKSVVIAFAAAIALSAAVRPAAAQRRVPAAGIWALSGSLGATVPAEPSFDNGLELAGAIEGYLTPRVSVRGHLAGTWWDIVGRGFRGTVKPLAVDGNLVYNWEGGAVHPYVTAGLGLYHYSFDITAAPESSDNKLGANLGGGLELFVARRAAFTAELLYHAVQEPTTSRLAAFNPRFWSFAVGAKAYFGR